jgi:hypothetical protein
VAAGSAAVAVGAVVGTGFSGVGDAAGVAVAGAGVAVAGCEGTTVSCTDVGSLAHAAAHTTIVRIVRHLNVRRLFIRDFVLGLPGE